MSTPKISTEDVLENIRVCIEYILSKRRRGGKSQNYIECIQDMIPFRKKDHYRGWGTELDDISLKSMPTKFVSQTFDQASHEDIQEFKKMSDDDKWMMAYWVERQALKKGSVYGFLLGILVGAIVVHILFWLVS